jgi:hypothetical protein
MNRPKLVVRYGKGGVFSPNSSLGFVVQAAVALVMTTLFFSVGGLLPWRPLSLLIIAWCTAFVGISARDAVAWFLATQEEQREFVNYVESLRAKEGSRPATIISKPTKVLLGVFISLILALIIAKLIGITILATGRAGG